MIRDRASGQSAVHVRRSRFAVTLVCLLAVVFAFGIEALGFHHHDTPGASAQCLVCRIAANLAGVTPEGPTAAPAVLPATGDAPTVRETTRPLTRHLTSVRLRAPPSV